MTKLKSFTCSTKSFQYLFDQYDDATFHEHQFKQTTAMSGKSGYLITYVDKTNEHIDAPSAAAAYEIAIAKKEVEKITCNLIDTPAIA
jgi:hypothetical protein